MGERARHRAVLRHAGSRRQLAISERGDRSDPTRGEPVDGIDGRVADNTLQQNFIFAVATLALATVVPRGSLQVVWACAIVFVLARLVFWVGYRRHPLYRAPGMAATSYLNLGMILYVLYAVFIRS